MKIMRHIVAFIAQFLVWARLVVSPKMVRILWETLKDGDIDSNDVCRIVQQHPFCITVPLAKHFKTE
jgi:hypothetical protein